MSRKNKGGDSGGEGTWLNTYADMVTLLLTFFVVLFSMSSVQQEKFDELIKSFTSPNGTSSTLIIAANEDNSSAGTPHNTGETQNTSSSTAITMSELPTDMEQLYQYLKSYVEQNQMESNIQVTKDKDSGIVYIRFSNDVLFLPDKYDLSDTSKKTLSFLGNGLKNMEAQLDLVQISGHTSDTNDPNYPVDDWRLSSERAASVAGFFEKTVKITPSLMVTMGYGSSHPVENNNTVEGRKANRRVEITIIGKENGFNIDNALKEAYDKGRFPTNGGGIDILIPSSSEETPSKTGSSSTVGATSGVGSSSMVESNTNTSSAPELENSHIAPIS